MRYGQLARFFTGVAAKRLKPVEIQPNKSNQHEINGQHNLRLLLGLEDSLSSPTGFIWLDSDGNRISVDAVSSWYDARRNHPKRSEWRLYYQPNDAMAMASPGDLLFVALRPDGQRFFIITEQGSEAEAGLIWLFGLTDDPGESLQLALFDRQQERLWPDFAVHALLEQLGINLQAEEDKALDALLLPFGSVFPTTREFSALARNSQPDVCPHHDPDEALLAWVSREEALFRRLERRCVTERLRLGFVVPESGKVDVDGFLEFSLSVQNRRKSRAGLSLENHLEAIFSAHGLAFTRGGHTENRAKPDFLFPGQDAYHDPQFPPDALTMLGVKSTCKDRWRQILSEADRIPERHLLTLQPGITAHQMAEMQAQRVQLVIPRDLQAGYPAEWRDNLLDLGGFMALLRERQSRK